MISRCGRERERATIGRKKKNITCELQREGKRKVRVRKQQWEEERMLSENCNGREIIEEWGRDSGGRGDRSPFPADPGKPLLFPRITRPVALRLPRLMTYFPSLFPFEPRAYRNISAKPSCLSPSLVAHELELALQWICSL